MAKFANNVDSDQGQLGTNVAWMYDSLAKRGAYKQVGFLFFLTVFTLPLRCRCLYFPPNIWERLRLKSIAMDKICTRIVQMDRFREGTCRC